MAVLAVLRRAASVAFAVFAVAGCTFSSTVVNAHQADLDASWIVPGRTTFAEVVARLGLPPQIQGVTGYRSDALHYATVDTFSARLEIGYVVTPTFERRHTVCGEDLLVTFDDANVVAHVSRTRTHQSAITGEQTTEVLDLRGVP